ncbi:MAG: nucleotidyltransferase family protein [bacterium]|nr:nucleotidyltransferase family protein [bacterium]
MEIENNKFNDNKELFLIILLLRYQMYKDTDLKKQIESLASDNSINFDEFIKLTEFHKVYTHIYEVVKKLDCFPSETIKKLRNLNLNSARKSLAQTSELKKLNKLLTTDNNISFTVLKGQPLSVLLYANTTQRSSSDIDILVDKNDIDEVFNIFEKDYIFLSPKPYVPLKYIKKYYHHLTFQNKQSNVKIEVHRMLFHYGYLLPFFSEFVKDKITKIKITGDLFNILSFHYNLFYCLIHGAEHQWVRLFWLYDITVYCKNKEFNINKLLAIAERFEVTHVIVSSLFLCDKIFNIPKLNGNLKPYIYDRKIKIIINSNYNCILSSKAIKEYYPFIKRIPFYTKRLLNDFRLLGSWKYRFHPMKDLLFMFFFLCPIYKTFSWCNLRNKR